MLLLAFASLGVLSSLLVIVGLRMNMRAFLLPWIFVMIADLLVECAHFVYLSASQAIYCLLCVISQYQEYKAGRGGADDDSYISSVNIQYSPPAATCLPPGKSILSPMMCPHTNCTLIPEETQINGSALGVAPTMTQQVKSPSTFGRQNSLLLKKHDKFNHGDKAKVVCCSGVIHPENILPAKTENGAHRINNGHHNHMIEALPGK
ncbi:hypothetical protein quinque_002780 [Culex quinquefasciatus]